jgi:hypothetical protein
MKSPDLILSELYNQAEQAEVSFFSDNKELADKVEYICKCMSNRAGVRLLLACLLAKIHNPSVDPRKPYTEISGPDSFSGRTYDERYITKFIHEHRLPVNPTTAFLTPTLRNINQSLTMERELVGRPRELYANTIYVLDQVARGKAASETVVLETIRLLICQRNEKLARISSLIQSLERSEDALPLSSEAIVNLLSQHLACKNSSRLPVLIVSAAYDVAGRYLSEYFLPLNAHNAADLQTGALGDIEICLIGDNAVVTVYEMKMKKVTKDDIDMAISKIARHRTRINNYIFVTTDTIDIEVLEYAYGFYEETGGTEIAVLDCISFIRHFLHLFHRVRVDFVNSYQSLVLEEPDSAVSQTLKEAFLALRQAAETGE